MNREFVYKHLKDSITGPTSFEDIMKIFEDKKIQPIEIQEALDALEKEGRLVKNRMARYGIPEQMNLITGRVKKTKKGYGFLIIENDADAQDLFIPPDCLNSAQNGDRVIVRLMKHGAMMVGDSGKRDECEVVRIIERHNKTYVGTYKPKKHYAYVVPDNLTFGQDIIVPLDARYHAQEGDKVLVEITYWGKQGEIPEGEITARIGKATEPGVDVLSLVYRYDLEPDFTAEQKREAQKICAQPMNISSKRRDFRYYSHIVTIDGADSKDLDDAVSVEILSNGNYMLSVHIADVAEYIRENSILDQEAYRRGTSVYFVDRVLPMLPPEISNGICSLNAGEDRLTVSCVMEVNKQGKVVSYELCESVINVEKRFTYDLVNHILEQQAFSEDESYVETFNDMLALSKILHKKRIDRGALEFDIPESKIILDDQGRVKDITFRERGEAEKIIEEFMILASETVAAHFFRRQIPFIYRVHEDPEPEKQEAFLQYIQRLGIVLPGERKSVGPKELQWILAEAERKECGDIVSMMMLRMMNHAYYTTSKTSHFGLASKQYTHFTSPIRRYCDLSIHRTIKEFSQTGMRMNDHRIAHYEKAYHDAAEQASACERNAEEAERASVDLKKAEYMVPYVGETFEGQISSVTSFGFFVRLPNSVEGLVHISSLYDDYYNYDADGICLVGEHTGRTFKLGQHVDVVLDNVSIKEANIDFVLKGERQASKRKPAAKAQPSGEGVKRKETGKKYKEADKKKNIKSVKGTRTSSKGRKTAGKKYGKRTKNSGSKTNSRKPKGKA